MANNIELGIVLASLGVKRVLQRQLLFPNTMMLLPLSTIIAASGGS